MVLQKNSKKNWMVGLVFLVFCFVAIACGGSAEPTLIPTIEPAILSESGDSEEAPDVQQKPALIYKVGDVIQIGDSSIFVVGWEPFQGDDFRTPDNGMIFVSVELLLVNNTQNTIAISSESDMKIKDDFGNEYGIDPEATVASGKGILGSEMLPGEKIRGNVGFEVSENVGSLQLIYNAVDFNSGKIIVDLGNIPSTVEPPAEFAGDLAKKIYTVGDVVTVGARSIKINDVNFTPDVEEYHLSIQDGHSYIIVDLTIDNQSISSTNVPCLPLMSLQDADGNEYEPDIYPIIASGNNVAGGDDIAPGESVRGQVGFGVPQSAQGLVFVLRGIIWNTDDIFISIQ